MSSVSSPSYKCHREQAAARRYIKHVGAEGKTKIGVVGAQVGVAEHAANEGLGLKKTKDYVGARITKVGGEAIDASKCAGGEGIFRSIVAMECAKTRHSSLVKGAHGTVDVAVSTIAAVTGAKTAVEKRVADLKVNLECPPKAE